MDRADARTRPTAPEKAAPEGRGARTDGAKTDGPRPALGRARGSRRERYTNFASAGVAGFVVDAAVLALGLHMGLPAWAARIPSFVSAVLTTWTINRRRTFKVSRPPSFREFGAYLAAMSVGMSANLSIYTLCLWLGFGGLTSLVFASAGGMVANYRGAKVVLGR